MTGSKPRVLLLGMGSSRRKLLYVEGGRLLDALTLEPIRTWKSAVEEISAPDYRIELHSSTGKKCVIAEDEDGVWIEEDGCRQALTTGRRVHLPRFEGHLRQ